MVESMPSGPKLMAAEPSTQLKPLEKLIQHPLLSRNGMRVASWDRAKLHNEHIGLALCLVQIKDEGKLSPLYAIVWLKSLALRASFISPRSKHDDVQKHTLACVVAGIPPAPLEKSTPLQPRGTSLTSVDVTKTRPLPGIPRYRVSGLPHILVSAPSQGV